MPWQRKTRGRSQGNVWRNHWGAPAYLVGTLLTLLFIQAVPCHLGQDRIQGVILQVQPLQALKRWGRVAGKSKHTGKVPQSRTKWAGRKSSYRESHLRLWQQSGVPVGLSRSHIPAVPKHSATPGYETRAQESLPWAEQSWQAGWPACYWGGPGAGGWPGGQSPLAAAAVCSYSGPASPGVWGHRNPTRTKKKEHLSLGLSPGAPTSEAPMHKSQLYLVPAIPAWMKMEIASITAGGKQWDRCKKAELEVAIKCGFLHPQFSDLPSTAHCIQLS